MPETPRGVPTRPRVPDVAVEQRPLSSYSALVAEAH
jgi:hypothetical protein